MLTEVNRGREQVYKANEDYWDTTTIDGKTYDLPLNDGVVYNIIKDEASSIAALRSGQVDIHESVRWQFVDELKKTAPDLKFKSALRTEGTYIALRTDKEPFNDVRVRRAMNLAVDQRAIQQSLLNGEGALLNYLFSQRWESLYTPLEELSEEAQAMFGHDPKRPRPCSRKPVTPTGSSLTCRSAPVTPTTWTWWPCCRPITRWLASP